MSKKTTKIVVLALVALAVGVAVWYLMRGKTTSDIVTVEDNSKDDKIVKYMNGIGYIFDSAGKLVGAFKGKSGNSTVSGTEKEDAQKSGYDDLVYIYKR